MELLNYFTMLLFVILGLYGPAYFGSSWVTAYYVSTFITGCIFIFFGISNRKPRTFLLAALLYLTAGSLCIYFEYRPGQKLFSEHTAAVFFLIYFCLHVLEVLFPKISGEVLAQTAPYPLISLPFYAILVAITYTLREQSLWISAVIPFVVIRLSVAFISKYLEKRNLAKD